MLNVVVNWAGSAHAGRRDKLDGLYVCRPLEVMRRVSTDGIVSILHDMVQVQDVRILRLRGTRSRPRHGCAGSGLAERPVHGEYEKYNSKNPQDQSDYGDASTSNSIPDALQGK